jgi:probable phosphoglycerate mutase
VTLTGVVADLVLIRHGESVANVAFPKADRAGLLESGLTGRDADVGLTALGYAQATAIGHWLAGRPETQRPDVVITSPYLRARETWRVCATSSGLRLPAPTTDDRLVDRGVGEFEMLTRAAIEQRFPAETGRARHVDPYLYRPPGGETFGDITERLSAFLADLHHDHPGEHVIVVAHDVVVLLIRAVVEGLDWRGVAAVEATGHVRNASITRFDGASGRLVLDRYNTVDHLR